MTNRVYNNSILYIITEECTCQEVSDWMYTVLRECKNSNIHIKNNNSRCLFEVNTVTQYDRNTNSRIPVGFSYIWMESSALYHILLGRNIDGTDRVNVKKIDTEPKTNGIYDINDDDLNTPSAWESWADIEEKEQPRTERIQLPPLIKIPNLQHLEDNNDVTTFKAEVWPSFVEPDANSGVDQNKLFCSSRAPEWLSATAIRKRLMKYSTSHDKKYPLVSMTRKRNILVTFGGSTDAMFCLQMCKVIIFCNPNNSNDRFNAFFVHPNTR